MSVSKWNPMPKTEAALAAWDAEADRQPLVENKDVIDWLAKLEELRRVVARCFYEESKVNSLETCLDVIECGPKHPPLGSEPSFVRKCVANWRLEEKMNSGSSTNTTSTHVVVTQTTSTPLDRNVPWGFLVNDSLRRVVRDALEAKLPPELHPHIGVSITTTNINLYHERGLIAGTAVERTMTLRVYYWGGGKPNPCSFFTLSGFLGRIVDNMGEIAVFAIADLDAGIDKVLPKLKAQLNQAKTESERKAAYDKTERAIARACGTGYVRTYGPEFDHGTTPTYSFSLTITDPTAAGLEALKKELGDAVAIESVHINRVPAADMVRAVKAFKLAQPDSYLFDSGLSINHLKPDEDGAIDVLLPPVRTGD